MINKIWLVIVALWKLFELGQSAEKENQAKRRELSDEVKNAIKTGNTRDLHRIMSDL
jgi:hypothetical protein